MICPLPSITNQYSSKSGCEWSCIDHFSSASIVLLTTSQSSRSLLASNGYHLSRQPQPLSLSAGTSLPLYSGILLLPMIFIVDLHASLVFSEYNVNNLDESLCSYWVINTSIDNFYLKSGDVYDRANPQKVIAFIGSLSCVNQRHLGYTLIPSPSS